MNARMDLDKVRVASPCHARWEDMAGDERTRFCGQCQKNVFNFSAMTRAEAETLIREKEGQLCGRFYRRADGRMLTTDCPTGQQHKRNRIARFAGAISALIFFFVSGCTPRMGKIAVPPTSQKKASLQSTPTNAPVLMGEVAYVPSPAVTNAPLMGRIFRK